MRGAVGRQRSAFAKAAARQAPPPYSDGIPDLVPGPLDASLAAEPATVQRIQLDSVVVGDHGGIGGAEVQIGTGISGYHKKFSAR